MSGSGQRIWWTTKIVVLLGVSGSALPAQSTAHWRGRSSVTLDLAQRRAVLILGVLPQGSVQVLFASDTALEPGPHTVSLDSAGSLVVAAADGPDARTACTGDDPMQIPSVAERPTRLPRVDWVPCLPMREPDAGAPVSSRWRWIRLVVLTAADTQTDLLDLPRTLTASPLSYDAVHVAQQVAARLRRALGAGTISLVLEPAH